MIGWLAGTVTALSLAAAVWFLIESRRGRPFQAVHLIGLAVLEAVLLVQVIVAVVLMVSGEDPAEFGTFIGYLAGSLVILPVGAFLGAGESSKWGSVAVAVACLSIPVVVLRMQDLWNGTHV